MATEDVMRIRSIWIFYMSLKVNYLSIENLHLLGETTLIIQSEELCQETSDNQSGFSFQLCKTGKVNFQLNIVKLQQQLYQSATSDEESSYH